MWQEVKAAFHVIERGGLILYPTDTIWGLGCDALDESAIARIYRLKERADEKSLIILLAEPKDIFQYVANPHPDIVSIVRSFTKPTTVIYPQALGLPNNLVNQDGSIAIRVTSDAFCKSLVKMMKRPLVSTSANRSGGPSPMNFSAVEEEIRRGVDHIVRYRQEEIEPRRSSRIVRINPDGSLDVIRP